MTFLQATFAIFLMALFTYIPRALPVAVFRKEITSKYIKSFLHYVPFAVLASLTFPEVFYSTGDVITAFAGTMIALLLAYCNKSLVIVAAGAILTVLITGMIV